MNDSGFFGSAGMGRDCDIPWIYRFDTDRDGETVLWDIINHTAEFVNQVAGQALNPAYSMMIRPHAEVTAFNTEPNEYVLMGVSGTGCLLLSGPQTDAKPNRMFERCKVKDNLFEAVRIPYENRGESYVAVHFEMLRGCYSSHLIYAALRCRSWFESYVNSLTMCTRVADRITGIAGDATMFNPGDFTLKLSKNPLLFVCSDGDETTKDGCCPGMGTIEKGKNPVIQLEVIGRKPANDCDDGRLTVDGPV